MNRKGLGVWLLVADTDDRFVLRCKGEAGFVFNKGSFVEHQAIPLLDITPIAFTKKS